VVCGYWFVRIVLFVGVFVLLFSWFWGFCERVGLGCGVLLLVRFVGSVFVVNNFHLFVVWSVIFWFVLDNGVVSARSRYVVEFFRLPWHIGREAQPWSGVFGSAYVAFLEVAVLDYRLRRSRMFWLVLWRVTCSGCICIQRNCIGVFSLGFVNVMPDGGVWLNSGGLSFFVSGFMFFIESILVLFMVLVWKVPGLLVLLDSLSEFTLVFYGFLANWLGGVLGLYRYFGICLALCFYLRPVGIPFFVYSTGFWGVHCADLK